MAKPTKASTLISNLFPEIFQTEESAILHCAREARRLGATPAGQAMREVSEHARRVMPALQRLAEARGHRPARGGKIIGRLFSNLRTFGADLLLSMEKSYRGTLLGAQHGVGAFLLLEDAAIESGDQELADFCAGWIAERKPLLENVEVQLSWFAAHADVALSRPTSSVVGRLAPHRPAAAAT